jgi:hypothetical protein
MHVDYSDLVKQKQKQKQKLKNIQSVDTWMRDAQSSEGEKGSAAVMEDNEYCIHRERERGLAAC